MDCRPGFVDLVREFAVSINIRQTRVYLIGFMGAGKSTVGKRLSEKLNWPFYDMDDSIEDQYEMTIPEIFDEFGEETFREIETDLLQELSNKSIPGVVSTGGGVPVNEENRKIMKKTGTIVYLQVSPDEAYDRIRSKSDRPKLKSRSQFKKLLREREEYYAQADYSVDTSHSTPSEVVEQIRDFLEMV